jgi:hypothetical protein
MSEPYILDWTRQLGTTANDYGGGVAIDSNNNVYITVSTSGSLDGNTNAGGSDAFLVKYDSSGTKIWTRQLGTTVNDSALGVAIDSNNNVYITGSTAGSLDGNTSAGGDDIFLVKYDSSGTKVWTRQLGTTGTDYAHGVAIDSNNNVYITGITAGSLDGNTTGGSYDAFLVKYDSSGTKIWTRQLGSTADDYAVGVAIDSNNNVYITGYTSNSLDGNTNAGGSDAFLVKYDSSGTKIWTRQLGTTVNDYAYNVAIDSNNNVYIAGYTSNSLYVTNAGSDDAFLVKYDSSGTKIWTRQLGTTVNDYAFDVAIDSNNNVYITGYTNGSLDGNTSTGSNDAFLVKYDSSGSKIWTRQLGTTASDYAFDVAIDSNNNVYITGHTNGSLNGNTGAGSNDAFLAKYAAPGWLYFNVGTNRFNQTYVNGFVDLSGAMVIRNDSNLIIESNMVVDGTTNKTPGKSTYFTNNMTIQSNLFANEDISVNGNLYLGGDLSVNGQFNAKFANGIIPYDAVSFAGASGTIQGNVNVLGDVSFSGPSVVELGSSTVLNVDGNIVFNNGSLLSTYNDNILSGSFAAGSVIYNNSLFSSVTVNGAGNVYIGGALYTTSDYRIKTNVVTLDGSYTIDNLNPVQYKNTLTGEHEYGFIAHDLQKVYPDMVVGEKDGDKYQHVMYTNLIGVIVKDVQELKHRLDLLENA